MMLLTALQQKYSIDCQTAYVATDYTCCPGVKDNHPQICFVPDQSLADEFLCKNMALHQIVPSGIPVRQQFFKSVEKNAAKRYLGIPEQKTHLLMMCGSMGCWPMEEMLEQLHQQRDAYITVVCGTNEELQSRLACLTAVNTAQILTNHVRNSLCLGKTIRAKTRHINLYETFVTTVFTLDEYLRTQYLFRSVLQ